MKISCPWQISFLFYPNKKLRQSGDNKNRDKRVIVIWIFQSSCPSGLWTKLLPWASNVSKSWSKKKHIQERRAGERWRRERANALWMKLNKLSKKTNKQKNLWNIIKNRFTECETDDCIIEWQQTPAPHRLPWDRSSLGGTSGWRMELVLLQCWLWHRLKWWLKEASCSVTPPPKLHNPERKDLDCDAPRWCWDPQQTL